MIALYVITSFTAYITFRSTSFPINRNMIDLISSSMILRYPCTFMDEFIRKTPIILFTAQFSINSWSLSVILSIPFIPLTPSKSWLSERICALKSPKMIRTSTLLERVIALSKRIQNSSFYAYSVVLLDVYYIP